MCDHHHQWDKCVTVAKSTKHFPWFGKRRSKRVDEEVHLIPTYFGHHHHQLLHCYSINCLYACVYIKFTYFRSNFLWYFLFASFSLKLPRIQLPPYCGLWCFDDVMCCILQLLFDLILQSSGPKSLLESFSISYFSWVKKREKVNPFCLKQVNGSFLKVCICLSLGFFILFSSLSPFFHPSSNSAFEFLFNLLFSLPPSPVSRSLRSQLRRVTKYNSWLIPSVWWLFWCSCHLHLWWRLLHVWSSWKSLPRRR